MDKETIDTTDWMLLDLLQQDARLSYAELGRRLLLSPPAVADRIRRLETLGVIQGYAARIDPARLGYGLQAFVRLRTGRENDEAIAHLARTLPEILECHQITGEDSYQFRVAVTSVRHLDALISRLSAHGPTTSSLILDTFAEGKPVNRADCAAATD